MSPIRVAILILVLVLLSGCSYPVYEDMQATHYSASFQPRVISQLKWHVNEESFFIAHKIEIFPYIHKYADFYSVFKSNSDALMESLFGAASTSSDPERGVMILSVEVLSIQTVGGYIRFDEASFSAKIKFTLSEQIKDKESTIAEVIVHKEEKGITGGAGTFGMMAHDRANKVINSAFLSAQDLLYRQIAGF